MKRPALIVGALVGIALIGFIVLFVPRRPKSLTNVLGDRWLVLADPQADTLIGKAYKSGAGFQTGCYQYDSLLVSTSIDDFEDVTVDLLGGEAGLRILHGIGIRLAREDFRRARIRAHGWKLYQAINLRPDPTGEGCFSPNGSLPLYPAIGEALAMDSFSIDVRNASGRRIHLDTVALRNWGALNGKIDFIDSVTARVRGTGLTVGFRAIAFDTAASDFICNHELSLVPTGTMHSLCEGQAKMSIGVEEFLSNEGKYILRARNDARPDTVGHRIRAAIGERLDLEGSATTWVRIFFQPSSFEGFARVRYVRTPYTHESYSRLSELPPRVRGLLPALEDR